MNREIIIILEGCVQLEAVRTIAGIPGQERISVCLVPLLGAKLHLFFQLKIQTVFNKKLSHYILIK